MPRRCSTLVEYGNGAMGIRHWVACVDGKRRRDSARRAKGVGVADLFRGLAPFRGCSPLVSCSPLA